MTDWELIYAVDLEPGDVILSGYGPAQVRDWRWSRAGRVTVDAFMLDSGLPHVFHFADQGQAVRRTKPRPGVDRGFAATAES